MANPLSLEASVFRVRVKYILPNAVTVMALCFGLTALVFTDEGVFNSAIACILISAILDGCDGRVARATGGTTRFGAELDSLADVVCFGAVPAFLVHKALLFHFGLPGWCACLLFQVASALRLARFNVSVADAGKPSWNAHFFRGIPAPAGAYLVLAPLYLVNAGIVSSIDARRLALLCTPLVGLLMVSTVPTFSSKALSRRALRLFFVPSLLLTFAAVAGLVLLPWPTLAIAALFYVLSLPLSIWRHAIYVGRS